jgi:3-dehydroquinate dehydratase-1
MNKLRPLLDRAIPLVAVSFRDNDSERLAREAARAGVDVIELRIDRYADTDPEHVRNQARTFKELPVVATIRSPAEGGEWTGSESQRLALFDSIIDEVDAVDIELSATEINADVIAAANRHDKLVIVSHHDFERTPSLDRLETIADDARALGADIVKISTMANSKQDLRTLASLAIQQADLGVIVIAMGAIGTIGRILFPALGSCLTFSHMGEGSAPGQLDFFETFDLMRKFYPDFNEQKAE